MYLFVCKAARPFVCLNLKCRVCTCLFVSGRLRRDGNEVAVIICHKMAFHKSTTHPQLNNRLLIIFCDKHKYIQNIPQIHKIALHSSTTHSLPLFTKQHTVHNPLLIFALCDKCKCTLHCVTNANAYRVVLCHKCNCLSLTNANSNICQHSRGHTTLHQKILGLGKLGPQIQIQMKMQMQIHSRGQTTLHQNRSQISSTRLVELYVCINWCVCVQMCATWFKQRLRLY